MRRPKPPAGREPDEPGGPIRTIVGTLAVGWITVAMIVLAAVVLSMAGVLITTAWLYGPKIIRDRAQYARFTATTSGRILESWVALELDQSRIQSPEFWRASAMATPCAIVEYTPAEPPAQKVEWDQPPRRAFCGTRLQFNTSYTLADVRELAPDVPFSWPMGDAGFAEVELRMDAATRTWLQSQPAHTFMHDAWPATTEWQWLTLELDRPIEQAIAGWSAPSPVMPLVLDPRNPNDALPAGIVASRRTASPHWLAVAMLGGLGLVLWVRGFALIPQLAGLAPQWRWFVMILPLLSVPTWVDTFPQFIGPMSAQMASVVSDMLGDLDPLDRLVTSDPGDAVFATGARLRWQPKAGVYADTFGRIPFARPTTESATADQAVIALSDAVASQVATWPSRDRVDLFSALQRDKKRDLRAAGLVFLRAARDAALDGASDDAVKRAALAFLSDWFVSPVETPHPRDLGFQGRQLIYRQLSRMPDENIAHTAARLGGGS